MATTKTIEPEVLDVLKRSHVTGKILELPEQLDRKLYEKVAKVIQMLGGKWQRAMKAHVFPVDAGDRVTDAVMAGEVVDEKQLHQFFETPDDLADRIIADSPLDSLTSRVLEPSAGGGAIVRAFHRKYPTLTIDVCENYQQRYEALVQMPKIRGIGQDFMACTAENYYDRIYANPPFRSGQDVAHVMKMYFALRVGGTLVSIMSPGCRFRTDKRHADFSRFMDQVGAKYAELPAETFKASGTNIRTIIVKITK